jgi:flagellar protein FlbT
MKPEETTTPLRQLYFAVQTMIMDPSGNNPARALCGTMLRDLLGSFSNSDIRAGLIKISGLVAKDRNFEALREIRALFPTELKVLALVGSTAINHQETADASWINRDHDVHHEHDNHRARA